MGSGTRSETRPPPKKPLTAEMGEETPPPALYMKSRGYWSQPPCNTEEKGAKDPQRTHLPAYTAALPAQAVWGHEANVWLSWFLTRH